jgi:hypothetical protein
VKSAISYTVRVVTNRLPDVAPAVERVVAREIEASARRIQAGAMVLTPVRTGLLRRSWATRRVDLGWEVLNPIQYAPYVEWGTRHQAPRGMLTQSVATERPRLVGTLSHAIKTGLS